MACAGIVSGDQREEVEGPSPGEVVLKKLFAQFLVSAEAKLKYIASQTLANPLSKYFQKGDDPNLDQLLASLKEVARFCLRSLLTAMFEWRKRLIKQIQGTTQWTIVTSGDTSDSPQTLSKKELEYYIERQQLAVEFIFCLTLTEILQQLPIHPVPESFIHSIEEYAFTHFKAQEPLKERSTNNPNVANAKRVADLYAEVIGVLSQVRFLSVRMRFFAELRNPQNSLSVIISVIEGLSFVQVKMYPVEELEEWFKFLQECATYMLEMARGEKVKHAMSALLVEILTPVAAVIKYEVSMPVVKKLVQTLYSHCYDHAKRQRHSSAYIPLVTVLLAISEDAFFLNNWHNFATHIVTPNIKKNDTKLQRIALDALYRLLWVYTIRIKGEGNVTTFNRLRPIVDTLFPRAGVRGIQHKDFPTNIFVKIIYFIARDRVDFVMMDIVLELVAKNRGGLNPERVIIGLRAFLMIADSLEKKEGDPPMPPPFSAMQSGSVTRTKTKFLTSTLTEQIAKKIGIASYYPPICQALSGILKQLDASVGRPLVSTSSQAARAPEEALGGERKPKLDLLKTCVAAIPRLMPAGMSKEELIELLSHLTIHIDNELPRMAVTALLNILTNFPTWRPDIVQGFATFVMRDIPDSCPLVLEGALKVLGQLLSHWRGMAVQQEDPPYYAMANVEACALVTFCSYRSVTRKLSLAIMKEVRLCLECLGAPKNDTAGDKRVMDVMEEATPDIIKYYLGTLTQKERMDLRVNQQNLTLWWLSDRSACFLEHGGGRESLRDAWSQCIVGLLEPTELPASSPLAICLTWPYILHRMMKAYTVIDPSFIVPERLERPPLLRNPRGGFVSQPEMFLWRNYLFFACCTAPPSFSPHPVPPTQGLYEAGMLLGDKHPRQYTARDLVHMVAPLVRTEGEIGEVVITALGLANPKAFSDLIEELRPWIQDALDLRRSDNVKKRRRRETERVHITRILSLAAEHGCFRLCPTALTKGEELMKPILEFIEGIKLCIESDAERLPSLPTDLRLHYSSLIANIINSFPEGPSRLKLLPREMRHSLFFMVAGWSGSFWHHQSPDLQEQEQRLSKPIRSNTLIYNVLQAMSALLCCGPIFDPEALIRGRYIYRWLENMLCSQEEKVQQLGQITVQLLLQNNREPVLLNWIIDHCYSTKSSCASLCFHALSNTFAKNPAYPCKMITVLHVILYNTASLDHRIRERAMQLLHILDRRFFASGERGSRRPELLGRITGSAYSKVHVAVSEELAFANPELTLPLFSEMVRRFEEAPTHGRQCILQLMKPWLRNVELIEESPRSHSSSAHTQDLPSLVITRSTNPVLSGSGWGSLEGTHLVLHNLLYLTTKYGDEFSADIENLWSALCTWPYNIRVALNYLARLTCMAGNLTVMLQQAKRVMIYFSHTHSKAIIHELMRELQCVDLITAEVQLTDTPPYYRLTSRTCDTRKDQPHSTKDSEGELWAVNWRIEVRNSEGQATPLPVPTNMMFFASMKDILKLPCRQLINMHRSNFALILLSEIVEDIVQFDWLTYLPLLLHVVTLGLDVHRPVVYQHSKKLLGNLTVLLACRDDYKAACEARLIQHEVFLHSPSLVSLTSDSGELQRCGSLNSLEAADGAGQTNLAKKARDLIKFISARESRRSQWPFIDHTSARDIPSSDVIDLSTLVEQILSVFQQCYNDSLKDKWARTALQWATSCSSQQFASQSFQLCRALQVPLTSSMLREVLPRLAESASDQSDELQNYVLEILLSLESALNNSDDDVLHPLGFFPEHPRQASDITPLPEDHVIETQPKKPETHLTVATPTRSTPTLLPTGRPPLPTTSTKSLTTSSLSASITAPPTTNEAPPTTNEATPPTSSLPSVTFTHHHRRTHSRGHSVTKVELPLDLEKPHPPDNNQPETQTNPHGNVTGEPDTSSEDQASDRIHSPPAAGAMSSSRPQSAGSRLKVSSSLDGEVDHKRSATVVDPPSPSPRLPRAVASTKEGITRNSSAPPIRLMNLFEPLPGSSQKPVTMETPTHIHTRPYSEIIPSSFNFHTHKPAMSAVGTTPTIATTRNIIPETTPPLTSTPTTKDASPVTMDTQKPEAEDKDVEGQQQEERGDPCNREDSLDHESADTSVSSVDSTNIIRVPSHPELRVHISPLSKIPDYEESSPIMRARSVTQLQSECDEGGEEKHYKRRTYSGSRETVPGYSAAILTKDNPQMRGSLDKLREKGSNTATPPPLSITRLPISHQNSPSKIERESIRRRISADPERERIHSAPGPRSRNRPRSMIETGSFHHLQYGSIDLGLATSSDCLSQLFWTSISLMLSDYEVEFSLALRLFGKVTSQLDFWADVTYTRLEAILLKTKWDKFPGVLSLLLKGLTLVSTTNSTRRLLSELCPHSTRAVFDPSCFSGLPLSIMALLPELILHFDNPTDDCITTASNIAKACSVLVPQVQTLELNHVLKDMGQLFNLYSKKDFNNTKSIWLKSVCHYIGKGYSNVTEDILRLMGSLLEHGCDTYHQPVLWIINEFLIKLEEGGNVEMSIISQIITPPISHLVKGPLWQEALDVLMLAIKNSSSLVQPPTPHLPMVDLGFFHESLPGPTLHFKMDLSSGSQDLRLAHDVIAPSPWKRPHSCQRVTREKLLGVINACGPVPPLFSSPSVVFTDEQALSTTIYSESEEEEEEEEVQEREDVTSVRASSEVLDSSQPESVLITTIGDQFNFLNQYSDEEESEDKEMTVEGPFSSGREKTYSSSLSSSQSSLLSEEEESHSQDHTLLGLEGDTSQEYQTPQEMPIRKHSRSVSPFPSGLSQSSLDFQKSVSPSPPRALSLEQSLEEPPQPASLEVTPPIETTPPFEGTQPFETEQELISITETSLPEAPPTNQKVDVIIENVDDSSVTITTIDPKVISESQPTSVDDAKEIIVEEVMEEIIKEVMKEEEQGMVTEYVEKEPMTEEPVTERETVLHVTWKEQLSEESPEILDSSGKSESSSEFYQLLGDHETDVSEDEIRTNKAERDGEVVSDVVDPGGGNDDKDFVDLGGLSEGDSEGDSKRGRSESDESEDKGINVVDLGGDKISERSEGGIGEGEDVHEGGSGEGEDVAREGGSGEGEDVVHEGGSGEGEDVHEGGSGEGEDVVREGEGGELNTMIKDPGIETKSSGKSESAPGEGVFDEMKDLHVTSEGATAHVLDINKEPPLKDNSEELAPSLSLELSDDEDQDDLTLPRVDLHRASHFISIADEEVEEVWQEHVSTLSRSRSPSLAVNSFYLFHRLFSVIRQQTCSLTQEATNFMSEGLWNISAHFLVTTELLYSQLELPRVYLDTELVSRVSLLDPLIFLALEIQNNLEHFIIQRTTVIDNLTQCKQTLLSFSPPPVMSSFSPHQKCLTLCHSVHQIHFQLLLLVSSYIKLLNLLENSIKTIPVIIISTELTGVKQQVESIILSHSRGLMNVLDQEAETHVRSMKPGQAMRYLQDIVATGQPQLALQLLHCMRSYFHDEQLFGTDPQDDMDVLFFAYAHCIAEGQEGVVGITSSEHNLLESHTHMMTQNVSLLSLLEKQQLPLIEGDSPMSSEN